MRVRVCVRVRVCGEGDHKGVCVRESTPLAAARRVGPEIPQQLRQTAATDALQSVTGVTGLLQQTLVVGAVALTCVKEVAQLQEEAEEGKEGKEEGGEGWSSPLASRSLAHEATEHLLTL